MKKHLLFLFLSVISFFSSGETYAQTAVTEITYKFSLAEVNDYATAKPVVHYLLNESITLNCTFIDEADVLKLTTHTPLAYWQLKQLLTGYTLSDKVEVSDGTVLMQITPEPDEK